MLSGRLEDDYMVSTVLEVGAIVALIGGCAFFFFQYMPMIIDFWNRLFVIIWQVADYIPEQLQPFIAVTLLLSGIGLLVKLL